MQTFHYINGLLKASDLKISSRELASKFVIRVLLFTVVQMQRLLCRRHDCNPTLHHHAFLVAVSDTFLTTDANLFFRTEHDGVWLEIARIHSGAWRCAWCLAVSALLRKSRAEQEAQTAGGRLELEEAVEHRARSFGVPLSLERLDYGR